MGLSRRLFKLTQSADPITKRGRATYLWRPPAARSAPLAIEGDSQETLLPPFCDGLQGQAPPRIAAARAGAASVRRAPAPETARLYSADGKAFEAWCTRAGLPTLPPRRRRSPRSSPPRGREEIRRGRARPPRRGSRRPSPPSRTALLRRRSRGMPAAIPSRGVRQNQA